MGRAGGFGKTCTPAGKADLAPSAFKVEESSPSGPPRRLKFASDHEGWVRGQKGPRQPSPSCSSSSSSSTKCCSKMEDVNPNPPKPSKKKKAATQRKGQTTGAGVGG